MPNSKEFMYLMRYVIDPVQQIVEKECDSTFMSRTELSYQRGKKWLEQAENEFHQQRQIFKRECYGEKSERSDHQLLDYRKIAAVLCKTFLILKPFYFNVEAANECAAERRETLSSKEYTRWAVDNILINYKFAHLVGVQLVYISLLSELLSDHDTAEMGKALNKMGHLLHYRTDIRYDTFDMNVVVGIARADVDRHELNMMLYAMLLYQTEMYTRERLKTLCDAKDSEDSSMK